MIYELYTSVALALWGGHCELFLIIPHFIISRLMAVSFGYKDFSSISLIQFHLFLAFLFLFPKILPFSFFFLIMTLKETWTRISIFILFLIHHIFIILPASLTIFLFPFVFLTCFAKEQKRRNFCTRGGNPNISVSRSRSGLGRANHGGNRGHAARKLCRASKLMTTFIPSTTFLVVGNIPARTISSAV